MAAFFPNSWLSHSNIFLRGRRGGGGAAPPASHIVAVVSSLRLGRLLHERCAGHVGLLLLLHSPPSFSLLASEIFHLDDGPAENKQNWCSKMIPLVRFSSSGTVSVALLRSCARCFAFFSGGKEDCKDNVDRQRVNLRSPNGKPFRGRLWTNVLIAINVLVYVAQIATQGKLLLWGAKVNYLIDKGQLWRLATSSFLHANIGHLMINCYSLNSIGPTVEQLSGPRRFLAIYFSSAIASSLMSYGFSQSPAVGASGAIFGLVGSFTVFILRHRRLTGGGNDDLRQIANIIALNMAIGILSRRVDNWGHLGGLLGGVAVSWLLGPAWQYQSHSFDGKLFFTDKAPIFSLFNRRRMQ